MTFTTSPKDNRGEKPGKNQALDGPFCDKYPGVLFEDKFPSANQMDGISKAGGGKMAAS